jgi:hypothetical protein
MRDIGRSEPHGNDQKDNREAGLEDMQPRSQISRQPLPLLLETRTDQQGKEKLITKELQRFNSLKLFV